MGRPASTEAQIARARAFEKAGNMSGALEIYRSLLDRFPANKRARDGVDRLTRLAGPTPVDRVRTLMQAGAIAPALDLAERLASGAASADVLELLGHLRLRAGRPADAIPAFEAAIAQAPGRAELHYSLGCARHEAGQPGAAAEAFEAAIRLRPGYGEARFNLGNALRDGGDLDGSARAYGTALPLLPGFADGYLSLGNVLRRLGRSDAAAKAYDKALSLRPGHPGALVNMAALHREAGEYERALTLYRRAVQSDPANGTVHYDLALCLAAAGARDAAIEAYRTAARLLPDMTAIHANLGNLLREAGRIAEARVELEQALALAPDDGAAYENYALVHRFSPDDPLIPRMRALAEDPATPDAGRTAVHFALARAMDDCDDRGRAFAHWKAANALRRQDLGYEPGQDAAMVASLRLAFPAPMPVPPARPEADGPRPVFILGMPRSGTTLVEQVLAAHPMVAAGGELSLLERLVRRHAPGSLTLGTAPSAGALSRIGAGYLDGIAALSGGRAVVTDKMPLNFRFAGHILAAIPGARILHLRRDPRAVCWSCFQQDFTSGGNGFAYDLRDVAQFHRLHDALMAHWHALWPGRIHTVDYEALTEAPEAGMRALVDAAGLPWDPACLGFHASERAVATASALQVRRPVYRGASEAWRRYESVLGPMLEALEAGAEASG